MTDWRKARADLAARAKASVIVPGWENDLIAAADAYALALAEWALAEVAWWVIDDVALDGVWNKLAAQVEAEHD